MSNHVPKLTGDRPPQKKSKSCHHCDGKGYIAIRDCSGEIQREENCSFCQGLGTVSL
jgi:DnaJ-class molecular chaperone